MIRISRFSGAFDCYDSIFVSSGNLSEQEMFEELKRKGTKIYLPSKEELVYNTIKDLIPYYPYGIAVQTNNTIFLSGNITDIEERESLEFMLKDILRYYNRAKRKKEPFNKDEVLSKVCWNKYNEYVYKELIDRVDKYGKKANIDGIELSMSKYYREKLRKELEKYE